MVLLMKENDLLVLATLSSLVLTVSGCAENKGLACTAISLDQDAIKTGISGQSTSGSTLCSRYSDCDLAHSACTQWWVVAPLTSGGHISVKIIGRVDSSDNYAVCQAQDPHPCPCGS